MVYHQTRISAPPFDSEGHIHERTRKNEKFDLFGNAKKTVEKYHGETFRFFFFMFFFY